jgi:hypothetical protein
MNHMGSSDHVERTVEVVKKSVYIWRECRLLGRKLTSGTHAHAIFIVHLT